MTKRLAIEYDTPDQLSYIPQIENLINKLGFTSDVLSSEQIIAGELFDFDAVIFPGGMGAFYGLRNYEDFSDAIRYFVANGGGYMGVCGGAYIAGLKMTETLYSYCPKTLGLMDVKAASPPWIKYITQFRQAIDQKVAVSCQITDEPHPVITPREGEIVDIVYSAGPLIRDIGRGVTPLLTYINDVMPPGDVALCYSIFGKGRVVVSSPHPEAPWGIDEMVNTGCQEWLYLNMISWVSQPEEKAYYPFLPWWVKKRLIPYPAIPTSIALGLGAITTISLTQIFKRKK